MSNENKRNRDTFQSLRLNSNLFVKFIDIFIAVARLFIFDEVSMDHKVKSG